MVKTRKKRIIFLVIILIIVLIYLIYGLPWERSYAEYLVKELLQAQYYTEYTVAGDYYHFWTRSYKIKAIPKYVVNESTTEHVMIMKFGWEDGEYGITDITIE